MAGAFRRLRGWVLEWPRTSPPDPEKQAADAAIPGAAQPCPWRPTGDLPSYPGISTSLQSNAPFSEGKLTQYRLQLTCRHFIPASST